MYSHDRESKERIPIDQPLVRANIGAMESDQHINTKKRSLLYRSFMKGLSIVLPAIITITLFVWVWDILRVYVVELTISAVDSVHVFEPRKLSQEELDRIDIKFFHEPKTNPNTVFEPVARTQANLKRNPVIADLPPEYHGFSPPGQARSLLQVILDANGWEREYDPLNGTVRTYHWFEYVLAAVFGLTLVVLLGLFTRNFAGRRLVSLLEWFVTRTPGIKSVYPHAKQLVEFFFSENKMLEFDTVAIIEYPRKGLWSVVFVTGSGLRTLQEHTGVRMVTVYVPSSPAPMTGYTMVMAAEDVIPLDISVENAMKFVVSGGVLSPISETVRPASGAQFALANTIDKQVRERRMTQMINKDKLKKKSDGDSDNDKEPEDQPDDDSNEEITSDKDSDDTDDTVIAPSSDEPR